MAGFQVGSGGGSKWPALPATAAPAACSPDTAQYYTAARCRRLGTGTLRRALELVQACAPLTDTAWGPPRHSNCSGARCRAALAAMQAELAA